MKFNFEADATQLLEITDEDTNETSYLIFINHQWEKISQEEYNNIRGN